MTLRLQWSQVNKYERKIVSNSLFCLFPCRFPCFHQLGRRQSSSAEESTTTNQTFTNRPQITHHQPNSHLGTENSMQQVQRNEAISGITSSPTVYGREGREEENSAEALCEFSCDQMKQCAETRKNLWVPHARLTISLLRLSTQTLRKQAILMIKVRAKLVP